MHAHQRLQGSNSMGPLLHKAPCSSARCFSPGAARSNPGSRFKLHRLQRVCSLVEEHQNTAHPEQQQATTDQGLEDRESYVPTPSASITNNIEQPAPDSDLLHAAADQEQPSSSSELSGGHQQNAVPYSFYLNHPSHSVPVQLPPPGASPEPATIKSFFVKTRYKPPGFMRHYPGPKDGAAYNYMSFLGSADPNGGKFIVPQQKVEAFLESYFKTMHHLGRRMHIAECYNDHPYRYFQELDFPWDLDINVVLSLIPRVIQIVTEEACRIHHHTGPPPTPIISMRTPYKVHLNYPNIITVESVASSIVRKAVINRCRVELSCQPELKLLKDEQQLQEQLQEAHCLLRQLSGVVQHLENAGYVMGTAVQQLMQECKGQEDTLQQLQPQSQSAGAATSGSGTNILPAAQSTTVAAAAAVPGAADLDWESIIDFPHGSFRLLGSCKAPWMDSDPEWVEEKCYSQVKYVDGVWMRQPLKLAIIQQCSILLTAIEQMLYEQSDDFLEASYQSVKMRQQLLDTKSFLRRTSKCLTLLSSLQAALQENDQDAAATLAAQAYKSYILVNTECSAEQQYGQLSKRQQRLMNRRLQIPPEEASAAQDTSEQHDQRTRKQQALEKLNKLQAGVVSSAPASALDQKASLIRPLTSQQSTPLH